MLADGWYCGYVGWSRRRDHYGIAPKLLLQLNAGANVIVKTDASWKVTTEGPITEADLLMGEEYDARRELAGWTEPGWVEDTMVPVILSDSPTVPVECYPGDSVRATELIHPLAVSEPRHGAHVFDMGQNFTGVIRIKATGPAGTIVTLRYAEVLTDSGELYTEALRGARCQDRYIKATDDVETWQPRFTFHGFRFVEVEGLAAEPDLETVTGIVLHTAMERTGEIRTASEMVNKLAENIRWGQRSNFLEVPTDCPQRDERLGWTGDAQIFIRTATFNYDVAAFFTKWLRDLFDAQRPDGWFCMVAPAINPWPNPDAGFAAWTDAGIICPWTMYHVYGDTRIVERYWDNMVAQMDYFARTSRNLIRPNEGFGDWVSLNADTPKDLLGTAYFAYDALLMADMARGIGREADAQRYQKLYEDIRTAFQKEFIEHDGGLRGRTQCAYVLALRFNLLPEHLRQTATAFLAQDLAYRGGHFSTGFVGLKDLMPTLSDVGRHDLACRILLNEDFPSWGYQIRAGATTTWERWDGWTEELGLQTPTMNSFNHYAFGAVGEWMFTHLAGIDISEVAYRRVRIRPHPDARLRHVRARYRSAAGWVTTEWLLDVRGRKLTLRCRIPVGAQALVELPVNHAEGVMESGRALAQSPGVTLQAPDGKSVRLEVGSGHYEFTMPWA
jgi:alpha-L-rhamnosidase